MKKKLLISAGITLIIGLLITSIYTSLKYMSRVQNLEEEFIALKSDDNFMNSSDVIEEITTNEMNDESIITKKELEEIREELQKIIKSNEKLVEENVGLEDEIDELYLKINEIPIDETLIVKKQFENWLDLFRNVQAYKVDMKSASEMMGVNSTHYHEWYPDLFSDESKNAFDLMVDTVFQDGEAIEVDAINYYNSVYMVSDTDGNRFYIYVHGETFYSIWTFSYLCEYSLQTFVEAVKSSDIEVLHGLLFYESYGSYDEEVKFINDEYIERFDLDTLMYRFIGVDLDGFKYVLYDKSGASEEIYINHSDSITGIKKVD